MKPVYYKSAISIFKALKEGSDIMNVPGYTGVELGLIAKGIFLQTSRSKEELEKYWKPSSEEEFNEALIKMTEHLKGL